MIQTRTETEDGASQDIRNQFGEPRVNRRAQWKVCARNTDRTMIQRMKAGDGPVFQDLVGLQGGTQACGLIRPCPLGLPQVGE
jgi:hypothetical protein